MITTLATLAVIVSFVLEQTILLRTIFNNLLISIVQTKYYKKEQGTYNKLITEHERISLYNIESERRKYPKLLAFLLLLLLGVSTQVQAGEFCSAPPFNGTIDGSNPAHLAALGTQITIDTDCTFVNFPAGNELTVTLNFQTNDPSVYLITFDNVVFTGNMACANVDHRIWFVNGSDYGSNNNCQDLFIPVEAINKQNPPTPTVGIGDPFTYTLRVPVLYDPVTGTYLNNTGSANDLHSITITDDLNTTGADLSLVGVPTVTWVGSGAPVPHTFSNVGGLLTFEIDPTSNPGVIIPAGEQIEIAITAVADNTNLAGTQFINTAKWKFGRLIYIDLDGDGVPEPNFFAPLPGENGVTEPLTISEPDLLVTKTSLDTAINLGTPSTFSIDVQNVGGSRAWDATIVDELPDSATAGMCDNDPTASVTARVFEADGVTPVSSVLVPGVDYTVTYYDATLPPPTCELHLTTQSAAASIGPNERLIITYQTQLDADTTADGTPLSNIAGATQWFSGDGSYPRTTYNRTLTDGTVGVADHEDSHTITTALTGYIFQKTVENATSGAMPATTAAPGDTLRYRLRLFNFSYVINNLTITDVLDPTRFDLSSFKIVTPLPAGATFSFNNTTGELQIIGDPPPLDLIPPQELLLEFEIDLLPTLSNGTSVINQATFVANGGALNATSDDPYVGGIAAPGDPGDPTVVAVEAPGVLDKTLGQATATIGEQFTYTITVPATPVATPLYDVRIIDDLAASSANLRYVGATVTAGGSWTLINTGTSTSPIIEGVSTGIDIPANGQAVIDVTVELQNSSINQLGLLFNNTASYSYNRTNGDDNTQTSVASVSSGNMTIVEPQITSITKTVDTVTPSPGDTIRYSVTLNAAGAAGNSDVFDVTLIDSLPLGLVYAGTPTVTVGLGVGGDNTIKDPDVTGDGTTTAQTLVWGVIEADIDIQAGDTVTISYDVQIDSNAYYNQTYTNSVVAQWSSLDGTSSGEERNGSDGVGGLNNYVTSAATVNVTTPPMALDKYNTQSTAAIGEQFTYRITVPALPQSTALYDVRITDDLSASAADLSFVSVTKVSGSQSWSPTNSGNSTNLVIEDTSVGIDIPAGEQIVIDIVVQLDDTATNNKGLVFSNSANYTFNTINNNIASQQNGSPDSSANMTIADPDNLTLEKTGPPTMLVGTPYTFTLNVHNTGTASAYDVTIADAIPNPVPGGMCDVAPTNIVAQLYLADGVTTVGTALVENTDFKVNFVTGTPTCTLTFTMITPAAAIPADQRLIISYDLSLDLDSVDNTSLTNIAAATEWFTQDTLGSGATGEIRTYNRALTDGTPATLDHEDAYTVVTDLPIIQFQKYVVNTTTGQDPGVNASPGDTLHYRIVATNVSTLDLTDFSITDEVDRLNAVPIFAPGTLNIITAPPTADTSNSNPTGGASGTGILDIRNLSLTAAGGGDDSLTIEFEVTLASVIDSGTVVLNQALAQIYDQAALPSDDPNLNGVDDPSITGDEDANETLIDSTPHLQIYKISDDLTGSSSVLLPGDTLRYTLTVKNIGDENAVNAMLQDAIPNYTTYVAGTTTLNGSVVSDTGTGESPLVSGMQISSPSAITAGLLNADAAATASNVATITFDVTVNSGTILGTVISNQGYLNADGAGTSGPVAQLLSDDPDTAVPDDPTRDIVGALPFVDALKTVALETDLGTPGQVDPGDTLRYTITMYNYGGVEASGVTLTDGVPANTTYIANSAYLNGFPVGQPDSGVSPLVAGIPVTTSDLTTGLPLPAVGYLSPGESATVTFDVMVNSSTPLGTLISNQGIVDSNELPVEPTDADGLDSNGDQPTVIAVGNAQVLSITKSVSVVGGGPAVAGGQLEYVVRVRNVGTVPAYDVEILDDLDTTIPDQMEYVPDTATLNGLSDGVVYISPTFTVDYAGTYGLLQPGAVAEFRFRVMLNTSLVIGETVTNVAQVHWNAMTQMASSSVSIDIGAIPGVANLNGRVWHDSNFDDTYDSAESTLENWNVNVYFKGNLLGTTLTNADGEYSINGLAPNYLSSDRYELRFTAPGAGVISAKLGQATSSFNNDLQRIYDIITYPNTNLLDLNLPIDPDGVVYNSITRVPVSGAIVSMLDTGGNALPDTCFDDPNQQNQVTLANGYYKFDINFFEPECGNGDDYLIRVTPPATGYLNRAPSQSNESIAIPALSNAATAAFSVPACLGSVDDAVPTTADHCEVQTSTDPPPVSIAPGSSGTNYHLHLTLDNGQIPGESQLFNNHIPLDPDLGNAVAITKTTPKVNVTRGELVPYTITVSNTLVVPLTNVDLVDDLPPGFKYVKGSARLNGVAAEPTLSGQQVVWNIDEIEVEGKYTLELLLVVGAGVQEGEYVNHAHLYSNVTLSNVSGEASATVRVVPDPTFDCSDIIGKVFDDENLNGYQDEGEAGIANVRVATARGLLVTTDSHGRFHITCAMVPNEDRGSNFILKVDERSLPSGYRLTTENPRVQRLTRGKLAQFNFGATIHHVVTLGVADSVFKSGSAEIRPQWLPRLGLLIEELRKQASVLRITYLADVEPVSLVDERVAVLKERIREHWREVSEIDLVIETEVFWRHGGSVNTKSKIFDASGMTDYVSGVLGNNQIGEDTERQLPYDFTYTPWMQDPNQFKKEEGKYETKQVLEKKYTTKKLKDLVPPILFSSGKADISNEFVAKLREILNSMRDRVNVRLHFIGHTDNVKLRGALKRKYEDNMGLSKERAGTTAEFFQRALELPPEAISYEGLGETKPVASNDTNAGRAKNRRVEVQVWYDEVREEKVDRKIVVPTENKRIMICRVETLCKLRYKEGHSRRTKLKNLVPPFHYDEGVSEIPQQYLNKLRQAMDNLSNKDNVQMRFIAYTDNIPLTGRDARIYGDHVGLSKANARRVAIAVQEALGLPNQAVNSTGRGASSPIASNNSEKGRALNRRIEVEFWHDDPLEDLPDEPQICPEAAAAETVERIYNPPEGDIKPIYFENGKVVIPEGYAKILQRAMNDIKDKGNVRLRFIGYTSNKRLNRRTAMVYGDDVGLSTARARRAMESVKAQMGLNDQQVEFEGRGYVQSNDVVNTGFIELDRSKVEVQVVYDELAVLDETEGVTINRITRDVKTQNPYALNLMRISVDGQPINDPNKNIPDVQRCTDVALDKSQVRFKFDNLNTKPRLNVAAWPNVISHEDDETTEYVENLSHFKMYTNYPWTIKKAEVRLFKAEQSTRDVPLDVVSIDGLGRAYWRYSQNDYHAPRMQLKYVLRVYDKAGNYDETSAQTLWVVDELQEEYAKRDIDQELLVGYGENRLALNNIPLNGGAVRVFGDQVPEGYKVWFGGRELPVNKHGEFGGEFIIPSGLHTVEVAITDPQGNGHVYQRDLELKNSDWFYVGIADLTASLDDTNGPAQLVTGDEDHYGNELSFDGRLAFYVKGKFANESTLTTSADTREGPINELFSDFMNKSPEALFRRIDPDYFYPTYGDDSTVEESAPTSGKFFIKYEKDKNYGLWGNFDIAYTNNDLAHVDRGLYGANLNYESDNATSFGEKRYDINLFAAEPGTVAGRDEFLGTSGSLYYLKHQDILTGSERIRIEVRDALSGMVVSVKNLTHGLDYDIDYIQGRVLLTDPISATAVSETLVDSGGFGGNNVILVARYEYTPGFDELNEVVTGGSGHYWFNDEFKFGATYEDHGNVTEAKNLTAYDLTWRKNAGTWIKLERANSQGPLSTTLSSRDGGYTFAESALLAGTDVKAKGQRVDASLRLEDIINGTKGTFTFYQQELDAGYAAPGLIAQTDTTQTGGTLSMPILEQANIYIKSDSRSLQAGLTTKATELDVDYALDENWKLAAGMRSDNRKDKSASVPLTQKQGDRTDVVLRTTFDSKEKWVVHGYLQDTTETTGNRESNGRVGLGGDYRYSDRLKMNGELSTGDLGKSVSLGTDYKMTDATDVYSRYVLENERTDNGVKARKGNMVSGFNRRYSDSASVYMEERYTHGDVPTGLTHSMGFDLSVTDALNLGAKLDVGHLKDNFTGAEIDRKATGLNIGYKFASITYAGALEYRIDETEQTDASYTKRKTWLMKNSLTYRLSPDWRLLAKLNHSQSISSLGDFYNGDFTEAIFGYAYRPVRNNSLNALFKYTYFYNMPTTDQVSLNNTAAQYIQKSHVVSVDAEYDLSNKWSLGGKYAYRLGQLSLDRDNPDFFDSNASLYILRANYHFIHRWDALLEGRLLDLPTAEDSRSGALIAVYRHFNSYIKAGIGYNFTDFSDDLTDLNYRSQGVFINAIGKF